MLLACVIVLRVEYLLYTRLPVFLSLSVLRLMQMVIWGGGMQGDSGLIVGHRFSRGMLLFGSIIPVCFSLNGLL